MKSLKESVKQILPETALATVKNTWDSLNRIGEGTSARLHPWRRASIRKLQSLKDSHLGERCFIIGNGPSLKQTDLSKLKNEYTIGMNRIYMLYPEMGFETSYYLSVNDLVIEQCALDIQSLDIPVFLSWRSRQLVKPFSNLHYLYTTYTSPTFSQDASKRLWEGATVTYVAMQLAFHLGFKTVILIGVDHHFTTQGAPNTTIESSGDDPNHFDPRYFGKGFRWQLPDLETSEISYKMAREVYRQNDRELIDATIGGKLQVFPKVEYESLF